MKYAEMVQAQAEVLIAEMEKGHSFLPFLKPGDPALTKGLPYNPTTGKPYRGGNMVMLWIAGMTAGYQDTRWLTFKQAQAIGAQALSSTEEGQDLSKLHQALDPAQDGRHPDQVSGQDAKIPADGRDPSQGEPVR